MAGSSKVGPADLPYLNHAATALLTLRGSLVRPAPVAHPSPTAHRGRTSNRGLLSHRVHRARAVPSPGQPTGSRPLLACLVLSLALVLRSAFASCPTPSVEPGAMSKDFSPLKRSHVQYSHRCVAHFPPRLLECAILLISSTLQYMTGLVTQILLIGVFFALPPRPERTRCPRSSGLVDRLRPSRHLFGRQLRRACRHWGFPAAEQRGTLRWPCVSSLSSSFITNSLLASQLRNRTSFLFSLA